MIGDTHKPAGDLPADAVAEVAGACRIAEDLERDQLGILDARVVNAGPGDTVVVTTDVISGMLDGEREDLIARLKALWPESQIVIVDRPIDIRVKPTLDPGLGDLADPLARRCQAAAVILSDLAESLRGMGDRERMVSADEDEFGAER